MKRLLLALLAVAAVAGAGGAAYWHFRLKPWMLIEETRYGRIQGLGTAVVEFHGNEHRMPSDLKELVDRGYLPAQSRLYVDPLKTGALDRRELPYTRCQFDLAFSSASVTISVPASVADAFSVHVPDNRRSWTVTGDLSVYSPR